MCIHKGSGCRVCLQCVSTHKTHPVTLYRHTLRPVCIHKGSECCAVDTVCIYTIQSVYTVCLQYACGLVYRHRVCPSCINTVRAYTQGLWVSRCRHSACLYTTVWLQSASTVCACTQGLWVLCHFCRQQHRRAVQQNFSKATSLSNRLH